MRQLGLTFLKSISKIELKRQFSQQVNMNTKRIAVCQMTSVADKETNLKVVSDLVSNAAKDNAEMIFFPEACDYICDNKKDIVKCAEPILTGNIVRRYRQLAAEHKVWLSMGGVHEMDERDSSKMYNTHLIIDSQGNIVQAYRKLHLFDVEIPEKKLRLKESDFSHAGGHIVSPVETPIGRIGMAICYDMRFPELSTTLSILRAEILTYPSAFTQTTGAAHWHILLRSRAIENQCYVIAAAQSGEHNSKRRSYGHALCIDPWGEILVDCGEASPSYKVAEISQQKLIDVRRNMPVFQHRRRDMYSLHALSLRNSPLSVHRESAQSDTTKGSGAQNDTSNVSGAQSGITNESRSTPRETGPCREFGHVKIPESCIFYNSGICFAFVNLRCVIPGHVLVAPVRPAGRNQDLADDEAADFFKTIRLVQKLMETVHNTESCTVTIQDGPDAGQTVKPLFFQHLHCHIMPRKKGDFIENDLIYLELAKHDQFKSGHPAKPARTLEEMEDEATRLRIEMEKMLQRDRSSC